MADLLSTIQRNIRLRGLLKGGEHLLVAVSGGVDSMVLLDVLTRLAANHEWEITVAHLNHQLRGRSSDADERLVRKAAGGKKLPIVVERSDVRSLAKVRKISIEMAARKARHEFLARAAARRKIRCVALAHHADDQVELFFLRLLRGTGGEGLGGMKWRNPSPANSKIELIRPLLNVSKSALEAYALENNISFREDATNRSLDIKRNRIRHELLPLIRKKYQPAIAATVSRIAEIIGAEAEYVSDEASRWLRSKKVGFELLPVALQRRVLQLQLQDYGMLPEFDLIETLRLNEGRAVEAATLTFLRDPQGRIRINRPTTYNFSSASMTVSLRARGHGEISFRGVEIIWSLARQRNHTLPRFKRDREFFDADKVGSMIVLRHWQAGDRFQPIGMERAVKLQDLFVNQKVPKAIRHGLIVATTASGELFWVENLRISERFKLSRQTKRRLQWRWQRA